MHQWPIVSRLVSLDNPQEIKAYMVLALETYCPVFGGFLANRIEELLVVTHYGGP